MKQVIFRKKFKGKDFVMTVLYIVLILRNKILYKAGSLELFLVCPRSPLLAAVGHHLTTWSFYII
jgi:hypothetical protein